MEFNDDPTRRVPNPATAIGWLALTVASLERSLQFYTEVLGFKLIERQDGEAVLGVERMPLLVLQEQAGAQPKPARATGLYHFAILVPTRIDLGHSLRHLTLSRYPLSGYADHLVSEALYLADPDGNGIEIYRDRPRSEWHWQNGTVQMASDPIDLHGLLAEAEQAGGAWAGLPTGTTIGHMHLQVGDIGKAEAFYHAVLGFDVVARWPGALFVSAGGYHHHLGLNTWTSRNGPPAPANSAGLRAFTTTVPNTAALALWAEQIRAGGIAVVEEQGSFCVADPWHNQMIVTTTERTGNIAALMKQRTIAS